jgi:hypothetical protein
MQMALQSAPYFRFRLREIYKNAQKPRRQEAVDSQFDVNSTSTNCRSFERLWLKIFVFFGGGGGGDDNEVYSKPPRTAALFPVHFAQTCRKLSLPYGNKIPQNRLSEVTVGFTIVRAISEARHSCRPALAAAGGLSRPQYGLTVGGRAEWRSEGKESERASERSSEGSERGRERHRGSEWHRPAPVRHIAYPGPPPREQKLEQGTSLNETEECAGPPGTQMAHPGP